MIDQAAGERHSGARVVIRETTQTIGDQSVPIVKGSWLETKHINMQRVVWHLCRQVVQPIHSLYRPIANGETNAACRCAIRYDRIRFNQAPLVKMEFASRDIADGKVRGIEWRESRPQGLEENQFKSIKVRLPIGGGCVYLSCVIPPLVSAGG